MEIIETKNEFIIITFPPSPYFLQHFLKLTGLLTGLVIDSGDGVTHVVNFSRSYSMQFFCSVINLCGILIIIFLLSNLFCLSLGSRC